MTTALDKRSVARLIENGVKRLNKGIEDRYGDELVAVRLNPKHASLMIELRSGKRFLLSIANA